MSQTIGTKYGRKKCESNALFKNDETLKAAEEICRNAIEKYYGSDAIERFNEKEESVKEKLSDVYDNQLWEDFDTEIDEIVNELSSKKPKEEKLPSKPIAPEEETEVTLDNEYYGKCPKCGRTFNYDSNDIGKLVRCRFCNLPMRLKD